MSLALYSKYRHLKKPYHSRLYSWAGGGGGGELQLYFKNFWRCKKLHTNFPFSQDAWRLSKQPEDHIVHQKAGCSSSKNIQPNVQGPFFTDMVASSGFGNCQRLADHAWGRWVGAQQGYDVMESTLQNCHFLQGDLLSVIWRSATILKELHVLTCRLVPKNQQLGEGKGFSWPDKLYWPSAITPK